jgi:hypothetical protein
VRIFRRVFGPGLSVRNPVAKFLSVCMSGLNGKISFATNPHDGFIDLRKVCFMI